MEKDTEKDYNEPRFVVHLKFSLLGRNQVIIALNDAFLQLGWKEPIEIPMPSAGRAVKLYENEQRKVTVTLYEQEEFDISITGDRQVVRQLLIHLAVDVGTLSAKEVLTPIIPTSELQNFSEKLYAGILSTISDQVSQTQEKTKG